VIVYLIHETLPFFENCETTPNKQETTDHHFNLPLSFTISTKKALVTPRLPSPVYTVTRINNTIFLCIYMAPAHKLDYHNCTQKEAKRTIHVVSYIHGWPAHSKQQRHLRGTKSKPDFSSEVTANENTSPAVKLFCTPPQLCVRRVLL